MAAPKRKSRAAGRTLRGLTTVTPGSTAAENLDNMKVEVFKVGLLALGGSLAVGAVLLAKNSIQKSQKENKLEETSMQVTTINSPAYHAERLRAAFNPSGFESLRNMDTTDVTAVMNVARIIRTQAELVQVAVAYRTLTTRRLSDDMREELSTREYQEFWNIMAKKPAK